MSAWRLVKGYNLSNDSTGKFLNKNFATVSSSVFWGYSKYKASLEKFWCSGETHIYVYTLQEVNIGFFQMNRFLE